MDAFRMIEGIKARQKLELDNLKAAIKDWKNEEILWKERERELLADSARLRRVRSWVNGWVPADLASDGDYQKGYKKAARDVKKLLEEQDHE